jgi:putative transposase
MTVSKPLPTDLIGGLLANYKKPEDIIGENGLLKQLTKALVERTFEAEMTEHLGNVKHDAVTNARNGKLLALNKPLIEHFHYIFCFRNCITICS